MFSITIGIKRALLGRGSGWICCWAFSASITFNTALRFQAGLEERKGHLCAGWTTFIQDKWGQKVLVLEAGNCHLLLIYCKEETGFAKPQNWLSSRTAELLTHPPK